MQKKTKYQKFFNLFYQKYIFLFVLLLIPCIIGCNNGGGDNTTKKFPVLTAINIEPINPSISFGNSIQFTATGSYNDGTTDTLTDQVVWESNDTSVAIISNDFNSKGITTPVSPGTVLISAEFSENTGSTELTIITNTNSAPVLDIIGNKSVKTGEILTFTITASDPDNDNLTYSANNLPHGSSFSPSTQIFRWTPAFGQAQVYPDIQFTVTDDGDPPLNDSESIIITVKEMTVLDNFPGYMEDDNWDDSWTMGVGSLSYFNNNPGYAHLLLDGPGVGGTYHNAEKKHYSQNSSWFLYSDFEIRLRNSNNNGWDAQTLPDPTYGLGSRGWGLWNDQLNLSGSDVIWFTSISPESSSQFSGTSLWIICNGLPVIIQNLNIDLTEWHTYHVKWRNNYIGVFIDDMNNPIAEVTNNNSIPKSPLCFTVWTDNYVFTGDFANPTIDYLKIPDIDQYIDVDYVKIYH